MNGKLPGSGSLATRSWCARLSGSIRDENREVKVAIIIAPGTMRGVEMSARARIEASVTIIAHAR